ncbi:beta-galactosidase [Stackebrandtia endophytica]|uniref:Beta-galactosidase n=2 Tax=Stackebrandtia endophytica TaxID=1496996 RepID=A0A543ASI6_9ACTN|nr:beta-galactosidase [Stackebrandtia endophytica]
MRWPTGVAGLCFGADYHPEHWPRHIWIQDMDLMRQAGVNLVTVGSTAWSRLEPAEGEYEFDWLDDTLDLLADNDIRAILAIPTSSPPPWFGLRHPDALTVDDRGNRLGHGSRDTYCVCAPAYRSACLRLTRELATRYRHHPALSIWQVHTTYRTVCHCDHSSRSFQLWLRERHGDLATLNEAWSTAVWGQRYSDWAQITAPRATTDAPNPAQALDFRRFNSDEMLTHFGEQQTVLRQYTPHIPVTTTFEIGDDVPIDHWRWSKEVDIVSMASYPDRVDRGAEEQTAFIADLARSLAGGRPWLLKEQATGLIHTPDGPHTFEPGRLERHAMTQIARGARGVMFEQWRAPTGGATAWRSAMLPHAGPNTRLFREIRRLGDMLPGLAELDGAAVRAKVAIMWDEPSWWALTGPSAPTPHVDYLGVVRQAHRVLWRHDVLTDFTAGETDLSGYRLAIIPHLYLATETIADNLAGWVAQGGTAVITYLSGTTDHTGRIHAGGLSGVFASLIGVRGEEAYPMLPDQSVRLSNGATGRVWSEHLHLDGAETICGYRGGTLDRQPAITRHALGDGHVWYVSTQLDDTDFTDLLDAIGILPSEADPDVETVERETDDDTYRIVINHGDKPTAINATGTDLVSGKPAEGGYQFLL